MTNFDFLRDDPQFSGFADAAIAAERILPIDAATAVLDCRLGAHIAPEGFSPWQSRTDSDLACFAEAGSTGEGAAVRGAWVKQLDGQQAEELLRGARKLCRPE